MDELTTRTFGEKLLALYERVAYLQKNGYNEHFRFSFVKEADVKAAVQAACREVGLLLGEVSAEPIGECLPHKAVIRVTVKLGDSRGHDYVLMQGIGSATDVKKDGTPAGDKACMKAMAAALKYALTSGLLIATGDDPEANENTQAPDVVDVSKLLQELAYAPEPTTYRVELASYRNHPRFDELMTAYKNAMKRTKGE